MAPPRIPGNVIEAIQVIWGEDSSQTATDVFNKFRRLNPAEKLGIRKVQLIVAELKKDHGQRSYPLVEWRPWGNESESGDDSAYLLIVDAIKMATLGRHLWQHEAKWGRRIRSALGGLNLWEQNVFIKQYALREDIAYTLNVPMFTEDLDGLLAYKPWKPANEEAYEIAVLKGFIPPPLGFGGKADEEQFRAFEEYESGEMDYQTYRAKMSYWKFAQDTIGMEPGQHSLFLDGSAFSRFASDPVTESWSAGRPDQRCADSVVTEGENHEGQHPAS